MKYFCLFLVIACNAFVSNAYFYDNCLEEEDRIVGGESVDIKYYPYQVVLITQNKYYCGGSIISLKFILTAAHCVKSFEPEDITVRAGSTYASEGGVIIQVKKIYPHESYNHIGTPDIAILKLKHRLPKDNDSIKIIELVEPGVTIEPGTVIRVSGWGMVESGVWVGSEVLQAITVPTVPLEECKRAYAVVLPHTVKDYCFCASTADHKGSCHGDSGGPAASEDGRILYGIVAFGRKCGLYIYPSVFMSVSAFRDWITDKTGI